MNLDDQLRSVLSDDAWTLPVRPDALDRVRRGRAAHRRRTVALSVIGVLAVAGGGATALSLVSHHDATLSQYASGGVPEGSPAPGITPAFTPTSGRDWLMTTPQFAEWTRTHTRPSPPPGQSTVASPAPLAAQSADLLEAVRAAGLPAGATMVREDSPGGQPGVADIHVVLPGGTPLIVEQSQAVEPFVYDFREDGGVPAVPAPPLADVPGTASTAVLAEKPPYGFTSAAASAGVTVVTRGGVVTRWYATAPVTLSQLKAWAFAAAQH